MKKQTQFLNKISDALYYFWYGVCRAKVKDPMFPITIVNEVKPEPLKVNAIVATDTDFCRNVNLSWNERMRETLLDFETYNIDFPSTSKVWIYSISRIPYKLDHPSLGVVTVPGNTSRKRYVMWTSFPNVVKMPSQSFGPAGEILVDFRAMDGRRLAMDLINPDNLGLDQDAKFTGSSAIGNNFSMRGIFWSVSNPPKKVEVDAAIARMERFYTDLLQRAEIMYEAAQFSAKRAEELVTKEKITIAEAVNRLRVQAMELTPEHHAAAEWFKVVTPWHPVLGVK